MEVVSSQPADYPQVIELLKLSWAEAYDFIPEEDRENYLATFYTEEKFRQFLENELNECLSLWEKEKIIGWMRLEENPTQKEFHLASIYLHPDFQGQGIGKRLIELAFEKGRDKGYDKIWLGVMEQNKPTLKWYEKLGFIFIRKEPFQMGKTEVPHLIGYKKL